MPAVQAVEKPLVNIKNGVEGAKPPTGSRGGSPSNIAPFLGKGVWGFGKDAEIERPKALQDAKPTKRSYRDRGFALSYKKQTFSTSWTAGIACGFFLSTLR
jgi:hypothetical protein